MYILQNFQTMTDYPFLPITKTFMFSCSIFRVSGEGSKSGWVKGPGLSSNFLTSLHLSPQSTAVMFSTLMEWKNELNISLHYTVLSVINKTYWSLRKKLKITVFTIYYIPIEKVRHNFEWYQITWYITLDENKCIWLDTKFTG